MWSRGSEQRRRRRPPPTSWLTVAFAPTTVAQSLKQSMRNGGASRTKEKTPRARARLVAHVGRPACPPRRAPCASSWLRSIGGRCDRRLEDAGILLTLVRVCEQEGPDDGGAHEEEGRQDTLARAKAEAGVDDHLARLVQGLPRLLALRVRAPLRHREDHLHRRVPQATQVIGYAEARPGVGRCCEAVHYAQHALDTLVGDVLVPAEDLEVARTLV
mmetsp:Transcript_82755/g.230164  ORF Transcript_82755/g.230164 Transcript_82755/m.230164 type:complete len:216 (-) Transcript_82755:396-1043(-)